MNIVIADDEKIILTWLKKNIEALSSAYRVVAACVNGRQALDSFEGREIDVLFTDIRMPVMDGMELLRRLGEENRLPYTIILSAYDDFAYARDAFRLGAKEFLLKPEITREGLLECLRLAEARMAGHRDEGGGSDPAQELLRRCLDEPDADLSDAPELCREACGALRDKPFTVTLLRFSGEAGSKEKIREILDFVFQEANAPYCCAVRGEREWALLSALPHEGAYGLVKGLARSFASFGFSEVSVSAGGTGADCGALPAVARRARETEASQRFYRMTEALDFDTEQRRLRLTHARWEELCAELEQAVRERDWDGLEKRLERAMQFAAEERPDGSLVKKGCFRVLMNLYWHGLTQAQQREESLDSLLRLNTLTDFASLREEFLRQAGVLLAALRLRENRYSAAVTQILQYMEQHYASPITLDALAQLVHLNRSYVSHLFKKETGSSLYDSLLRLRLEKAKELLVTTSDSVQQIGCRVGIPDSAYFSRLFKKQVGASPAEFRRRSK